MKLYVVRHAIAWDPDPIRWPADRDRPLTASGEKQFRRAARGIRQIVPEIDALLTSPYTRAHQTATILKEEAHWPSPRACAELEAGAAPERILRAVFRHERASALALVGHEPDLSDLCAYLLLGRDSRPPFKLKKGAVVCLRVECGLGPGVVSLDWLLPPRVLREFDG